MSKSTQFALGGIVVALVIIGAWQFYARTDTSPSTSIQSESSSSASTGNATSTMASADGTTSPDVLAPQNPISQPAAHPLPIAVGDRVISWEFKGAYTGNPELVAKAQTEINRLTEELKTATSSAMILSVGIANQYELLGKGKEQYDYLGRAIQADVAHSLPWHNLGVLLERLGAYQTARIAYEKATQLQSEVKLYHYAYLEFLMSRMKENTAAIEKAFTFAEAKIGITTYLLDLRAQWEKS